MSLVQNYYCIISKSSGKTLSSIALKRSHVCGVCFWLMAAGKAERVGVKHSVAKMRECLDTYYTRALISFPLSRA